MDSGIARSIAHAAQQMHLAATVDETLEVIVRSAAEALPAFDHIGLSTIENGGEIKTRASTGALVRELDDLQYSLHEGPCVDTLDGADVVTAARIRHTGGWPEYVSRAVPHGLQSQLAVRLDLGDRGTIGGLNLYSTTSEDIAETDVVMATFFATHAALALGKAREVESLKRAVDSREHIGQAVGILMERYGIDEGSAQAFLWRTSSHADMEVRDVATALITEANDRHPS